MEELVYTSAPQGLQQGSSGFCTVEMTKGMPAEIMDSLETLSAYDNDPSKTVNWMHVQLNSVRGRRHVLSRVGPLKGEFSGRTNKLAHHIALSPDELPPQGPTRIVGLGGPLQQQWSGEVRYLSPQASLANLRVASMPRPCRTWEAAVGDAGVAGAVLSKLRGSGTGPLWVIRTPQMDALAMTDEVLALLSGPERWDLTFCTYLHSLPRSVECRLRWVLPNSPAMSQLQNIGSDHLLDLGKGSEEILRDADSQLVDAARRGKAVVGAGPSPAIRMSTDPASGSARRRGMSQMDLNHLAPTETAKKVQPLPTKSKQLSPLRWVVLGVGLGSIPACAMLFLLMSSDPAPVAAMRELDAEQDEKPPVKVLTLPAQEDEPPVQAKKKVIPPPSEKKTERKRDKKKREPPPEVEQGPKIKSEIPRDLQVVFRLPNSALSLSLDEQTIHTGLGVYEVSLKEVASVKRNYDFEITEPDYAGIRDLLAVAETGQQKKLGTIITEPDRVLFAWSPDTNRSVAAAFALTHELLIKDETHHNTIQFLFDQPDTIPAPPTPISRRFEISIPAWVYPEFEVLLRPTYYFSTSDRKVAFDPLAVVTANSEQARQERKIDLRPLDDPRVQVARLMVLADVVGGGADRKVRYSSNLVLGNGDQRFDWSKRKSAIREQAAKHNDGQKKRKPAERTPMIAADRLQVIEEWASGLNCQLELFARVGDRNVLIGKTAKTAGSDAAGSDTAGSDTGDKTTGNTGGESK